MARRFFDSQPFLIGEPAQLGESASHHVSRVLRMRPGDELVVFNGEGGEWLARIEEAGKRGVTITPLSHRAQDRTPKLSVVVGLPVIKGERMDYALQKATEMGASGFQLLELERSDVRLNGERLARKMRHWQQVIISACEQCGMNRLPELHAPEPLNPWLASVCAPLKLIAHPGLEQLDPALVTGQKAGVLLTGPEGGFSESELAEATKAGFRGFALGERVLRAETAPVALLASLLSLA